MLLYEQALTSQSWEQVSPLVHDQCCVTFSNGTFRGKDQVAGAFIATFSKIKNERYAIKDIYWVHQGNEFATCIYNFEWSGIIYGRSAAGAGRGTTVLVKEGGNWKLLSEHLGPPPV